MRAEIHITLKAAVLDPQGQAIANALETLGFEGVANVRQGKLITLDIDGDDPMAVKTQLVDICEKLLANTVIEDYTITLMETAE